MNIPELSKKSFKKQNKLEMKDVDFLTTFIFLWFFIASCCVSGQLFLNSESPPKVFPHVENQPHERSLPENQFETILPTKKTLNITIQFANFITNFKVFKAMYDRLMEFPKYENSGMEERKQLLVAMFDMVNICYSRFQQCSTIFPLWFCDGSVPNWSFYIWAKKAAGQILSENNNENQCPRSLLRSFREFAVKIATRKEIKKSIF